jgi:TatD DNase family protein
MHGVPRAWQNSMQLIDTHTHLDFPDFDNDRDEVLRQAATAGVTKLLVVGVQYGNWQRLWDLVQQHDGLYAAFGLHPLYLDLHRPQDMSALRDWLSRLHGQQKLCAVGEFGLDYYLQGLDRQRQQTLFEAQLALAQEFELPVLLHVRRAHAAVIAALKAFRLRRGGIIHAFSGSHEEAREYLKLGFKLGLGGAPTWPQAKRLRQVIARLPLEALVLETDSPDMPPAMYPHIRNSPVHLPAICMELAQVLGISAQTLANTSSQNARQLFAW